MQSRAGEMSGLTTVVDRIRYWARTDPEREAFVFRRQDGGRYPLSKGAYLRLATRFAARLQSLGLQPGDVVCNFLVNSPERAVTDLGIMLSGAAPMNGAPLLADGADVKGCLRKGRAKALLVDPDQKSGAWEVCQRVLDPCQPGPCQSADLPDLKQVLYSRRSEQGAMLLLEELEASREQFRPVDIKSEDVAYIFSTSGSTGYSKLVMHTHESLRRCFEDLPPFNRIDAGSKYWSESSLGWIGGHAYCGIYYDFTRVLIDERAGRPSNLMKFVWEILAEEQVSVASLYPTSIPHYLERPELWRGRHKLKTVFTGAQVVPRECIKALSHCGGFTPTMTVLYGLSETGFLAYTDYELESQFEDFLAENIAPGRKIRIVDDSGAIVPNGTDGEIQAKYPSLTKGFVGDPDATKKVFTADGWFRTMDRGHFDSRGRLFVMGRQSDVIMKGPYIIVPQWLEVRVRKCPGVKDVVIVPVPDEEFGSDICACVIREEGSDITEEVLDKHCEKFFLSSLKGPVVFKPKHYLFVDQFPLNDNGKLDRKRLKGEATKSLGLK